MRRKKLDAPTSILPFVSCFPPVSRTTSINSSVILRKQNMAAKGCTPWNKGKTGFKSPLKKRDEEVFVANSSYARHHIKSRILDGKLIEYRCACCGIGPEWQGKPMPLILDHINGVNNDNRLENLRFVCSNCDSQLDTYKSRNRKNRGVAEPGLRQRSHKPV